MQWQFIVALVVAVPIILLPVAYLWYLNVGGVYKAIRGMVAKKAAQKQRVAKVSSEKTVITGAIS